MNKETFIESIEAIRRQNEYDIEVSRHFSKAFIISEDELMPDNHYLQNALINVLQIEMGDTEICKHGQTWIEYFLWDLNFGEENYRLTVFENGKEVKMSNAGELYDFLKSRLEVKTIQK